MLKKIILGTIKVYKTLVSPLLGQNCRFWPSCSEYACQAVGKYGTLKGFFLSFKRLLKCHPLNKGGVDIP